MLTEEEFYLEYELSDSTRVLLQFNNINDRDGCHISLDMYKTQLRSGNRSCAHTHARKIQWRAGFD